MTLDLVPTVYQVILQFLDELCQSVMKNSFPCTNLQ